MPEQVSVIGLGNMGSALARTLVAAGYVLTVWNRSSEKAEPLVSSGARLARSAREAAERSSLTLACVTRYEHVYDAFGGDSGLSFDGRTLVNLSWGSPEEADAMASWVAARGGRYLDGGITQYPSGIGKPETELVFSGPADVWDEHGKVLRTLGGESRLISENVGAGNALCLAIAGAFYHSAFFSFFESAAYAARYGIRPTDLWSQTDSAIRLLADSIEASIETIEREDWETDQATLFIQMDAVVAARDAFLREHQEGTLVRSLVSLLERAADDGHADEHPAAVFPMLRDGG